MTRAGRSSDYYRRRVSGGLLVTVLLVPPGAVAWAGGAGDGALRMTVTVDGRPDSAARPPSVRAGAQVVKRYRLVNHGEAHLYGVRVLDPGVPGGVVRCPRQTLGALREFECVARFPALPGARLATARAEGTSLLGRRIGSTARSGYDGVAGASPSASGSRSGPAPRNGRTRGPRGPAGTATVTYTVTNRGNRPVHAVRVGDTALGLGLGTVDCGGTAPELSPAPRSAARPPSGARPAPTAAPDSPPAATGSPPTTPRAPSSPHPRSPPGPPPSSRSPRRLWCGGWWGWCGWWGRWEWGSWWGVVGWCLVLGGVGCGGYRGCLWGCWCGWCGWWCRGCCGGRGSGCSRGAWRRLGGGGRGRGGDRAGPGIGASAGAGAGAGAGTGTGTGAGVGAVPPGTRPASPKPPARVSPPRSVPDGAGEVPGSSIAASAVRPPRVHAVRDDEGFVGRLRRRAREAQEFGVVMMLLLLLIPAAVAATLLGSRGK
ncbi:hypothetical protein O1L60_18600 [Streptomyces diastatochromogenes]|nr:hypothetical protein [Streptomyces diastatochromogenes]